MWVLMTHEKQPLEYIVAKGENAGNQHFLPFPLCCQILLFQPSLNLSSANTLNLDQAKTLSSDKE